MESMLSNVTVGDLLIGIVSGLISGAIVSIVFKLIDHKNKKDETIRTYKTDISRHIDILTFELNDYETTKDTSQIKREIQKQPYTKTNINFKKDQKEVLREYIDIINSLDRELNSEKFNASRYKNKLGKLKYKLPRLY